MSPVTNIIEQLIFWAKYQPNKIAIYDESRQISYSELLTKVKQHATYLHNQGVKNRDKVAIHMPRSADVIISILGTLMCGACFVPIDIKLPQKRVDYILEDSDAAITTTELFLKSQEQNYSVEPFQEKQLAYMIYTSGSTGAPKGVMVSHENLNYYMNWIKKDFSLNSNNIFDFSSSIAFDFSITTFLFPISIGASICICNDTIKLDPLCFLEYIQKNNITFLKLTPAYFSRLVMQAKMLVNLTLPSVSYIFLGGEACITEDIKDWLNLFPEHKIVNEYGPTEATVAAVAYTITKDNVKDLTARVPIGVQAIDAEVFVVNEDLQIISDANTPGELLISGKGVAQGYYNNTELTEEKFIRWTHPLSKQKIIVYRTGDRVCRLSNGYIDYLGRNESIVKFRGYRVNLLEIEEIVEKIFEVKKCLMLVSEENLHCFLQLKGQTASEKAVLEKVKSCIKNNFPEYLLPGSYTIVSDFPLTNNEKIDTKKLLSSFENKQTSPNKIESYFLNALNKENINIDKSFIENGGHSLSAMSLLISLRKNYLVEFSIVDLLSREKIKFLLLKTKQKTSVLTSKSLVASSELSRQQEALVFLDSMSQTTNYNIVSKIKFHGKINKEKLFLSIHKVISINPQLGIRIYSKNGVFFQEQHANLNKLIEKNIFPHKLKSTRDLEKIEFSYRFDLSKELPVRINFVENDEDASFLIVTWHHIVSDEWSSKVFFKEIQDFYQSDNNALLSENKKNVYSDYSLLQQTDSFNVLCKDAIKHFNTLVSNDPIDLPFDYKKSSNNVLLAKRVNLKFPKTCFLKIKKFCMQKNITPFLLFIIIYQITLFRFTWQRKFNIGVPYANREHSGAEDCIGLFSNSLPFPTDIKEGVSFSELLELNRKLSLFLMENQFLPFKCLVEEICKNREFGENPLFQVMFVYQNNQEIDFSLSGVHAEIIDSEPIYAKIPFCLFLKDCGDSFSVTLEFAKNLFEDSTAKSFLFSFKGILESALNDPSVAIEDLNLIPKNKQALISIISGLKKEYPKDRTIPQIIQDYATITPNAIAIEQADLYITYKQLNELSDVLAEKITKGGVLEGQVIGIACKRSAEHIIGLVAILKLNCTYSPIDIKQPETRNSYQINDANINCILVDKNYSNELKTAFNQLKAITIEIADLSENKHTFSYFPKNEIPAYIMYTSGTTGVPKGVVISQKAILSLTINSSNIPISSGKRIAHCSSVCFDASTFEIWSALLNGATLVIADEDEMSNFNSIRDFYNKKHIDIAWLTKSLFDEICYFDSKIFSHLEYLIVGGEALNADTINKILSSKIRPKFLLNGYGPTEVTTFSSMHVINKKDLYRKNIVPIGKPIDNTEIMLLDQFNHKVPQGFKGTIYINSDRLAIGYTKKELTEKSFIQLDGKTWYSSGDLARINKNGNLEFLGREDKQIKLRGFRIERSDIEANILNYPHVKQAHVELIDEKLIAFIVLNEESKGDTLKNDIDAFLRKLMPNYMIPADSCFLTHIPITINGKIDSKLIEKNYRSSFKKTLKTPLTKSGADNKLGSTIFDLWEKVLNHRNFSVEDSFFSVGGNSIKLLLLTHLVYEAFPVKVSIADIMKNDTVKLQVELIKSGQAILGESIAEIVLIDNNIPPLYLIHPSSGQALSYQSLNGIIQRSVYAINDPYFLDVEHCYANISAMAEHYASLILKHLRGKSLAIGGWSFGGLVAIKVAKILQKNNINIVNLVLIDTYKSYNKTVYKKIKNNILKESNKTDFQLKKSEFLKELQNLSLAVEYKHEPYNGHAVLIHANERGSSLSDELTEFSLKNCGWLESDFTNLKVIECKGNHHSLFLHDNVRYLANLLDKI